MTSLPSVPVSVSLPAVPWIVHVRRATADQ
jgi:hypothetical protein